MAPSDRFEPVLVDGRQLHQVIELAHGRKSMHQPAAEKRRCALIGVDAEVTDDQIASAPTNGCQSPWGADRDAGSAVRQQRQHLTWCCKGCIGREGPVLRVEFLDPGLLPNRWVIARHDHVPVG